MHAVAAVHAASCLSLPSFRRWCLPPPCRPQVDGNAQVSLNWVKTMLLKAERAPDDVGKAAAEFGTTAHGVLDCLVKGDAPPVGALSSPELARVVDGFKRWHAQSGLDLNPAGDTVVYSTRYGYAGALDCVGKRRVDGKLVIVDFKTSMAVHSSYALQLAAYVNAYKEVFGNDPEVGASVKHAVRGMGGGTRGVAAGGPPSSKQARVGFDQLTGSPPPTHSPTHPARARASPPSP